MATIVNARDVMLQAYSPRVATVAISPNIVVGQGQVTGLGLVVAGTKMVFLSATTQVFQVAKSGTVSPASTVLTADLKNLTNTPSLTVISGTITPVPVLVSGKVTIPYADLTTDTATIRLTVVQDNISYSDETTIVKVREGIDGLIGFITNESHAVPADYLGNVTNYNGAGGNFKVFQGINDITSLCIFSIPAGGNTSGLTASISASGVYAVTGALPTNADTVTLTLRATFGSAILDKIFTIQKAKAGVPAKTLTLTATSQIFQISKAGVVSPSSVVFTSLQNSLAGSPVFSIMGTGASLTTTSGSSQCTLTYANMASNEVVTVKVTQDGHEDTITVVKLREGIDGTSGSNGLDGTNGVPGSNGTNGTNGVTTYTWIAYANNSAGTTDFTVGANTGQTYIGIANNKTTSVESTLPSEYTWSLIKGTDGVAGSNGLDGTTTYTWFAYANNSTGSAGFTNGAWTNQTYLGIATNKLTATESTSPTDYAWSLIKGTNGTNGTDGLNGSTGVAGTDGTNGTNGTTTYTWIAYANNATGSSGFTNGANTGQTYIGIANNKTTEVESAVASDYTWSLIKGADGVAGTRGADGVTTYTWFAYSNNSTGSSGFTTGAWTNQTYIGIATNKSTAVESQTATDYDWSLIKGADGVAGADAIVGLLTNESAVVAADSGGVVASYSNTGGTFKVYQGIVDKTGTATYSVVSSSNVTVSIAATGVYTVSALTQDFGTALLRAVFGGVTVDKVYTIAKAKSGVNGTNGTNGTNGLPGTNGTDGVTTYTWIAYANNSTGSSGFTTGANTGQTYIGLANNRTTATESLTPADYTWSLIKGTDGVQGTPGVDGVTTYTWIAYSNNSTGSAGFTTGAWTNQTYIGIATNKTTATESQTPSDYSWSLIKGLDGTNGVNGTRGSRTFYVTLTGTTAVYSDSLATTTAAVESGPVLNDVVTQYNTSQGFSQTKFWTASGWVIVNAVVDGNLIVSGTVGATQVQANLLNSDNVLTRGLTVRDVSGNIILSSGQALDYTRVGGTKPPANATVGATFGSDINGKITPANASTFIDAAAINNAQIGTLDAQKINTGFLSADRIQAGVITADKLNIGSGRNLLRNSTWVERDATQATGGGCPRDWRIDYNAVNPLFLATPESYPDWCPVGMQGLDIFQNSNYASGPSTVMYVSTRVPVVANRRYEFSVYSGAHRANVYTQTDWYGVSNNYIATSFDSPVNNDEAMAGGKALSAFKQIGHFGTAPAGAVEAQVIIYKSPTKNVTGYNDSHAFLVAPMVAEASANQTVFSSYSPVGLGTKITGAGIETPNLSAITATIGTLRTATSGARMEISDNVLKVFDANNVKRVQLGNLDL